MGTFNNRHTSEVTMNPAREIAARAIKEMTKELVDATNQVPLNNDEINLILKKHITSAFKEAGATNKKELYRALTLIFHPDKFHDSNPELFTYLKAAGLSETPFKLTCDLNKANLFNEITTNPSSSLGTVYEYLLEQLTPLFSEYERYNEPFKTIAMISSWLSLIPFILVGLVALASFLVINFIVDCASTINIGLLNIVTKNQYSSDLTAYLDSNFEEIKQSHLNALRNNAKELLLINEQDTSELDNMSNEALFETILNQLYDAELNKRHQLGHIILDQHALKQEVEEQYKQTILTNISVIGFIKLKFVVFSLYYSIIKPVSEHENKWLSLFVIKPLQIFAAPLILTTSSIIEFVRFANTALLFISIGTAFLCMVTLLALINSPLYALDLYRYSSQKINEYLSSFEAEPDSNLDNELSKVYENNGGPKTMLRLIAGEQITVERKELKIENSPVRSSHFELRNDITDDAEYEHGEETSLCCNF